MITVARPCSPPRPAAGIGRGLGVVVLLLLLLGGCVSEQREEEIGATMAAQVNSQLPLVHDPVLNAYLSSVGRILASVSERPKLDYHFYLINSAAVNAFALPGGYVYVTRGLVDRTRSAAELAAVLAHEIGHVAARHGVQKLERYMRTGSVVDFLYSLILGGEPAILRQNSLRMAGVLWSASHSRKDEEKADRLAVRYLVRAGIDPHAMVSILQTLLQEERSGDPAAAGWFASHPLTTTRIAETKAEISREEKQEATVVDRPLLSASYPAFLRRVAALPAPPDAR
jgi:predicted Zn-dependent protease